MTRPLPAPRPGEFADTGEPDIFDTVDETAGEDATLRGEADLAASHEAVSGWLKSWGTPEELPRPKCGE